MRAYGYFEHAPGDRDELRDWHADEYEIVPEDKVPALIASHYPITRRQRRSTGPLFLMR